VTLYKRLNLKRDCIAIYVCAQLHRWSANYTFKTEIVCYRSNGNYCGFCYKAVQLQTSLQTSKVIETVFILCTN